MIFVENMKHLMYYIRSLKRIEIIFSHGYHRNSVNNIYLVKGLKVL